MIALPRWVSRALTGVLAVYTVAFAAVTMGSSAQPMLDSIAIALFVFALLALAAGRSAPRLRTATEVLAVGASGAIPVLAAGGLDPVRDSYSSGAWWVTAVACIAVLLLLLRGRRGPAGVAIGLLVLHTVLWSGLPGVIGFGVAAVALLVGVAGVASWAMNRIDQDMVRFHAAEREAVEWQAAQDAYHSERQVRLVRTGRVASRMLERIAEAGTLTEDERDECRLLEQTIRDEIRGRALLNDAVRGAVMAARRRGAVVQVLDDGGLEGLRGEELERLRDQVAAALEPLRSTRIIIRTAPAGSGQGITVVATTVDPMAAALGLDDGDEVDLWLALDRPVPAA